MVPVFMTRSVEEKTWRVNDSFIDIDREKDSLLLPMIVGRRYGTLESRSHSHDGGDIATVFLLLPRL